MAHDSIVQRLEATNEAMTAAVKEWDDACAALSALPWWSRARRFRATLARVQHAEGHVRGLTAQQDRLYAQLCADA